MLSERVLFIITKCRSKKCLLFLNISKLLHKRIVNCFSLSHMLKRFHQKLVKIPVDQIIFIQKISVKSLPGKPTFFRNLLYGNVFYRSRFHTFFHCSCEPVFRFFSLCQISLVACFSHSFSSSFKYGVIVSYTLRW